MTNCEQTKVCTTCQEEKVISEFYNAERGKYGVKSKCKKCYNINKKKYYIKTKEKRLEYCRQYALDNKEKIKEHYLNEGIKNKYWIKLPDDFDINIYKKLNQDLSELDEIEILKEYIQYGHKNRVYK